jgi:small subunit ribosomal protein S1
MVIATAKKSKVVEIEQTEAQKNSAMNGLMSQVPLPPKEGDTVEGPVVNISNGRIYIDLAPFGTGIIYGREYLSARDVLKNTHIGDVISAKVIMTENAEGYTEVSLREARQAMIWLDVEAALQKRQYLNS